MFYTTHTLYKLEAESARDEYGRIVSKEKQWREIGRGRCDKNTDKEFRSPNGEFYTPSFHIVCDKVDINAGDFIKAEENGSVYAQGKVYNCKSTHYYNYTEIWI